MEKKTNKEEILEVPQKKIPDPVPYIVHEAGMARMERVNLSLLIGLAVAVGLLFASNMLWLLAWVQYDYSSDTVTVESTATGHANYIGASGDIYNGESTSQETNPG